MTTTISLGSSASLPRSLLAAYLLGGVCPAVIGEGQECNYIGSTIGECAVNRTTQIFQPGEAEAEEQDGSGFFNNSNSTESNSTGNAGLNKAVVGVYVVGWIVAVLGGGFATAVAFGRTRTKNMMMLKYKFIRIGRQYTSTLTVLQRRAR